MSIENKCTPVNAQIDFSDPEQLPRNNAAAVILKRRPIIPEFRAMFPECCPEDGHHICPQCRTPIHLHQDGVTLVCERCKRWAHQRVWDLEVIKNNWQRYGGWRRGQNHQAAQLRILIAPEDRNDWARQLELVRSALRWAQAGFPVFPVHSIDHNGNCTCGNLACESAGKHPWLKRGLLEASKDPVRIIEWWSYYSAANVSAAMGDDSGVFVLDVDGEEGAANLAALEEKHGKLPDTFRVKTGSGGSHYYFKIPPGMRITNSPGDLPDKIDVRGTGGYVLVPPSNHHSGGKYEYANY